MTWAISQLDIATLWAQGLTGKGVGVAHLDTGVDASHVALAGRVVDFAEFDATGNAVSVSGPYDSAFHGAHTAGTICGSSCDGLKLGVAPEGHAVRVPGDRVPRRRPRANARRVELGADDRRSEGRQPVDRREGL